MNSPLGKSYFPYSVQIPLCTSMQVTRTVFCNPARVAPAAGIGSVPMPVVLEASSGIASCPLLLGSPDIQEMRSNYLYSAQYDPHSAILPSYSWRNPYFLLDVFYFWQILWPFMILYMCRAMLLPKCCFWKKKKKKKNLVWYQWTAQI